MTYAENDDLNWAGSKNLNRLKRAAADKWENYTENQTGKKQEGVPGLDRKKKKKKFRDTEKERSEETKTFQMDNR